jgi:signal transduction histidine kinase
MATRAATRGLLKPRLVGLRSVVECMRRRYERGRATASSRGPLRAPPRRGGHILLREEAVGRHVEYVRPVRRPLQLARRYGLDLLIVAGAVESVLEVAVRDDALRAPRTTPWLAAPAVALVVLTLLGRRRFRFAAAASLWLLAAALSFVDGRLVVLPAGVYIAGMAAALLLGNLPDGAQARIGLAVVVSAAAIVVSNDPNREPGDYVFVPLLFAVAWLAGNALRHRGARAEAAEVRAADAERERETLARVAVAEERTRIARELHDIVAHAVSVMVLQAGAVRHTLPEALAAQTDALRGVEQTGRTALAEMRHLLGAMRDEGDGLELGPQPGLGSLDALLRDVRRAGLGVRLHVEGEASPLPRALDLSAYRIVQEGLTNALKHAGASQADVVVRYAADELAIEVRDNGAGGGGTSKTENGHGLVGVRERVKIYGGDMTAGAAAEGGFVLRTRLPLAGHGA